VSSKPVFIALGYAGLIPFVIPSALLVAGSDHSRLLIDLIEAYAFGIICFLTGSWWGMALKPGKRINLMLSNFYFLIAFFIYVFAPQVWMPIAAVLLICIFMTERIGTLFPELGSGYSKMRAMLTLVASVSMIAAFFAG
jgi:hypothetical protein